MSDAEMEREIRRRARELEAERKAAERERKAEERARRADERQRQKTLETGIRTAGRVVTSRAGQSLLRNLFETLFGKRR
jgi:hypothetical protein